MPTASKISAADASVGAMGQVRLAAGERLAMRMWRDEAPTDGDSKPPSRRAYETVGYVVAGRADLLIEGETIALAPGDSWLVPAGAEHSYRILERFTAVEAIAPPVDA